MKIFGRILLIILAVIILTVGGLCIWQWDNINSLITAVRLNDDEISEKLGNVTEKLSGEMTEVGLVRELTEEEIAKIKSGEMSSEEAVGKLTDEKVSSKTSKNAQRENIINKYVAQLYVLEAQYEGELSAFVDMLHAEFYAYPKEERNTLLRDTVIASHIGELSQMEATCDGKVKKLLDNLTSELKAMGADTSIVKTLTQTYTNKKNLKKAQYMKDYNKHK